MILMPTYLPWSSLLLTVVVGATPPGAVGGPGVSTNGGGSPTGLPEVEPSGTWQSAIVTFITEFFVTLGFTAFLLMLLGLLLVFISRGVGRRRSRHLAREIARPPSLDLVMGVITLFPWLLGLVIVGWHGLVAAILGQVLAAELWMAVETVALRRGSRRPRPSRFAEARVGRGRSRVGQWLVIIVLLPVLWTVRFGQLVLWPVVQRVLRRQVDVPADRWLRVTRRQAAGLVGRDRLWAWFGEWALGIAATAVDMLGALEALWMPVRFRSHAKNRRLAAALPGLPTLWLRPGDLAAEPDLVAERLQAVHDAMDRPAWREAPPDAAAPSGRAVVDDGTSADRSDSAPGASASSDDHPTGDPSSVLAERPEDEAGRRPAHTPPRPRVADADDAPISIRFDDADDGDAADERGAVDDDAPTERGAGRER